MPAGFAKLSVNGRSQAVRVSRHVRGVLLETEMENSTDWFAEMDKHADDTFLEEGRAHPPTPRWDLFD